MVSLCAVALGRNFQLMFCSISSNAPQTDTDATERTGLLHSSAESLERAATLSKSLGGDHRWMSADSADIY